MALIQRWRGFAFWFKQVFLQRKEYVPGDTCRFIWQKVPEVRRSFVYYRVFHMLGNLLCLLISFFHIFRIDKTSTMLCEKKEILCFGSARVQYEWFFYVTSLGLLFNTVQSVWGLVLTLLAYFRQNMDSAKDSEDPSSIKIAGSVKDSFPSGVGSKVLSPKLGGSSQRLVLENKAKQTQQKNPNSSDTRLTTMKEHRIFSKTGFYWGFHSFSLCLAITIDIVFWTLIYAYNPNHRSFYIINQLAEHGLNVPLMVTDYCVVAFPILPLHILFAFVFPLIYLIVNYLYFLAGGKDETHKKTYLYSFLDWNKPGKAVVYGIGVSVGLSIFMIVFLAIDHYKFKIRPKALFNTKQPTEFRSSAADRYSSL